MFFKSKRRKFLSNENLTLAEVLFLILNKTWTTKYGSLLSRVYKSVSEGKTQITVCSLLHCGKKYAAVGPIILLCDFRLRLAWCQKTNEACLHLCAYYGAGSKTHKCHCLQSSEIVRDMRKGQQKSKTCDHFITKSHLSLCGILFL